MPQLSKCTFCETHDLLLPLLFSVAIIAAAISHQRLRLIRRIRWARSQISPSTSPREDFRVRSRQRAGILLRARFRQRKLPINKMRTLPFASAQISSLRNKTGPHGAFYGARNFPALALRFAAFLFRDSRRCHWLSLAGYRTEREQPSSSLFARPANALVQIRTA